MSPATAVRLEPGHRPTCPVCGTEVSEWERQVGLAYHVPYQGTIMADAMEPAPPTYATSRATEVSPVESLSAWTLRPCGHQFRELEITKEGDDWHIKLPSVPDENTPKEKQ